MVCLKVMVKITTRHIKVGGALDLCPGQGRQSGEVIGELGVDFPHESCAMVLAARAKRRRGVNGSY
jgi:hypothetical protein